MNDSVYSRLLRVVLVIILVGIVLAFWQVWLVLGLAFLIYVYVKDRGKYFPKVYKFTQFLMKPFN